MFTLAGLLSWLGTEGIKLLLGAAASALVQVYNSHQAATAQRDAGRHEVEAAQAQAGLEVQGKIADVAAKPVSEDDAIATLNKGAA
jgi:hypothetical protein